MNFSNRVCQKLHEEHAATFVLLERLEKFLADQRSTLPDKSNRASAQLLTDIAVAVDTEIARHFDFEEKELFTYLAQAGEREIGAHLTEEHRYLLPLGRRLATLARSAVANGFDAAEWGEFLRLGKDFCQNLQMHAHKEDMALLPLLADTMDAASEERLYQSYVVRV